MSREELQRYGYELVDKMLQENHKDSKDNSSNDLLEGMLVTIVNLCAAMISKNNEKTT